MYWIESEEFGRLKRLSQNNDDASNYENFVIVFRGYELMNYWILLYETEALYINAGNESRG